MDGHLCSPGRDSKRLRAAAQEHPLAEVRVAAVDDPASLEAALAGSGVVINCAGPFIDTSLPIVDVAIRSGVHYLDVAAEQSAVLRVFDRFRGGSTNRRHCHCTGDGVLWWTWRSDGHNRHG